MGEVRMAEDNNEGVAYLLALKRSIAPSGGAGAAAAPARTPDSPAGPPSAYGGEPFRGADKRRSPRFKCQGSAELRIPGSGVRTWATFTDVSLNGCYVEAQATFPAGTTVQMKLEANDSCIETKGNVRVSYPMLGMGIAFEEMSLESRSQLQQLLATLARRSIIPGPGVPSRIASSTNPARSLDGMPAITNPAAAVKAIVEFFDNRQMLSREDFLNILRKSQKG
jgi:hypothetical protein